MAKAAPSTRTPTSGRLELLPVAAWPSPVEGGRGAGFVGVPVAVAAGGVAGEAVAEGVAGAGDVAVAVGVAVAGEVAVGVGVTVGVGAGGGSNVVAVQAEALRTGLQRPSFPPARTAE